MTTSKQPTAQSQWDAHHSTAVAALQAAVLHETEHGPLDFGAFLASALTTVAANVGGVDRLTAGRSGSWEADHIRNLAGGEMTDAQRLAPYRTAPVVVPLNIADLIDQSGYSEPYEPEPAERDRLVADRAESCGMSPGEFLAKARHPQVFMRWVPLIAEGATYDGEYAALEAEWAQADDADRDAADTRFDIATDALTAKWARRYERYAETFTAAVTVKAAELGLTVPVTVPTVTDPDRAWEAADNPDVWSGDQIVGMLWEHARETTPTCLLTEDAPTDGKP
ncbi:hypothetical protein ACFXG4_05115 [Nocardia sp. NPDC059246]|uniref:hypothetical protein n=1 Tax=unclassified Nocardia TaxID=2637762 RepID=UPI0036B3A9D4